MDDRILGMGYSALRLEGFSSRADATEVICHYRHMIWLLRTQTRLCTEYLLEGVPTQDMLVMKEREREIGDGVSVDADVSRRLDCVATLRHVAKMLEDLTKIADQSVLDIVLTQLVTGGQVSLDFIHL